MRGVWEETRGEYLDLHRKRREAVKVHTKYCVENQEERGAVSLTGYKQAEWKYFQVRFNSRLQTTQNTSRSLAYLHNKERYQQFLNRNNFPVQH